MTFRFEVVVTNQGTICQWVILMKVVLQLEMTWENLHYAVLWITIFRPKFSSNRISCSPVTIKTIRMMLKILIMQVKEAGEHYERLHTVSNQTFQFMIWIPLAITQVHILHPIQLYREMQGIITILLLLQT